MGAVKPEATRDAVALSLTGSKRDVRGLLFRAALLLALLLSLGVLLVLIATVVLEGWSVFADRGSDFFTSGTSKDPDKAGVWQAVVGSFWIAVIVTVLAFPLGIAAAIYLEEYAADTRINRFININIRNLAGVPSIVYGILGFTVFVKALESFTGGRSVLAAGFTLAVLVLPIVIITAAEALRAVPVSIREAGYGVGAAKWEVIRSHVLPYAAPGILTGTVLSLARALGEAAPLILVGAVTGFFTQTSTDGFLDALRGRFTAMPMIAFDWARQPGASFQSLAAASILVMLAVILAFNAGAILLRNHYDKKRQAS